MRMQCPGVKNDYGRTGSRGDILTNLQVFDPPRTKPEVGDLFAMQLADQGYLFGRVISLTAVWTKAIAAGPAVLIYIYDARRPSADLRVVEDLTPDRLLVAPIMTNRQPWVKGYFRKIANSSLGNDDVLSRHVFYSVPRRRYYDDAGNEVVPGSEPIGVYGLHSFRTIDDLVSDAVGIPRVAN